MRRLASQVQGGVLLALRKDLRRLGFTENGHPFGDLLIRRRVYALKLDLQLFSSGRLVVRE